MECQRRDWVKPASGLGLGLGSQTTNRAPSITVFAQWLFAPSKCRAFVESTTNRNRPSASMFGLLSRKVWSVAKKRGQVSAPSASPGREHSRQSFLGRCKKQKDTYWLGQRNNKQGDLHRLGGSTTVSSHSTGQPTREGSGALPLKKR